MASNTRRNTRNANANTIEDTMNTVETGTVPDLVSQASAFLPGLRDAWEALTVAVKTYDEALARYNAEREVVERGAVLDEAVRDMQSAVQLCSRHPDLFTVTVEALAERLDKAEHERRAYYVENAGQTVDRARLVAHRSQLDAAFQAVTAARQAVAAILPAAAGLVTLQDLPSPMAAPGGAKRGPGRPKGSKNGTLSPLRQSILDWLRLNPSSTANEIWGAMRAAGLSRAGSVDPTLRDLVKLNEAGFIRSDASTPARWSAV